MGNLPNDWLVPSAAASAQQNSPVKIEETEIAEFGDRFKSSTAPKVLETELSPGATGSVGLDLAGPAWLAGSAQWIGTANTLKASIAMNGSPLVTGTTYGIGTNHGGSYLHAQTPVGGRATLAVTNTSSVRVKLRILLVATAR